MGDIDPIIDVVEVEVLGRYIVEMTFEDGTVKVLDLEPYLWGEVFEPLLEDYELFTQVQVDPQAGTITWPNGADISPRRLYQEARPKVPAA